MINSHFAYSTKDLYTFLNRWQDFKQGFLYFHKLQIRSNATFILEK